MKTDIHNIEQPSLPEETEAVSGAVAHDQNETSETLLPVVDPAFVEQDIPTDVVLAIKNFLQEGEF